MNLRISLAALLGAILLTASPTYAQFTIPSSTLDCGGGQVSAGGFTIAGTIGQPDASTPLTGGTFAITGGFWPIALPCRADIDGNGLIEPADVSLFVNLWFVSLGQGTLVADFDGDGLVQPADVSLMVQFWLSVAVNGC